MEPVKGITFTKKHIHNLPNIEFMVGDSSKKIPDESFQIQKYKLMYNKLWLSDDGPQYSVNKFNIISLMFCLHYFFKDINSLNNLIENIATDIAEGGYIIGACFDGHKIFEYFIRFK